MAPTPKSRVLLTVDDGYGPLAGVRALRKAGYETWLAVSQPATYAARSRAAAGVVHVALPASNAERYVTEVADAAARLAVDALLPGTETSLRALTGRERLCPPGIEIATPEPAVLDRATDKWLLGELARQAGLEVPTTIEISNGDEGAVEDVPLPCVVKPVRSVEPAAGSGKALRQRVAHLVRTREELRRSVEAAAGARVLVQPYLSGTLAAICGVAWEGELVCAFHQRSPRIWPLRRGISSYAVSVAPDPEREAGVAALIRSIGWSGVFGVQFLLVNDRAYVIDLNPRLYGSLALAVASGLNLPAIWADLVLGGAPAVNGDYRIGVRYRAEEDDYRALLGSLRRGERAAALRGLMPRAHTVHAVFSLRDPGPSLISLKKALRSASSGRRR